MKNIRTKNEQIKRKYFNWIASANGYSEKTLQVIEAAIWGYDDFTKHADYADFDNRVAERYKKHLSTQVSEKTGKPLSLTFQYHKLRHLKIFFQWLSGQPGYKSKIRTDDAQYLRLSKKETRIATSAKFPEYPTQEYILKLCESIDIESEVDMRDRALIAFTALSGMRDLAIVSLPIRCFDPKRMIIDQDPTKGVKTKFSKPIITRIFEFDETLVKYFLGWYDFLVKEKLYSLTDPLFPRTEVGHQNEDDYGFTALGIEPKFWETANTMRKMFKQRAKDAGLEYFSPHKFRHFAANKSLSLATTGEEIKAVSQNFGHENIGTTLGGYGYVPPTRQSELIGNLDFSGKKKAEQSEDLKEIKQMLKDIKEK